MRRLVPVAIAAVLAASACGSPSRGASRPPGAGDAGGGAAGIGGTTGLAGGTSTSGGAAGVGAQGSGGLAVTSVTLAWADSVELDGGVGQLVDVALAPGGETWIGFGYPEHQVVRYGAASGFGTPYGLQGDNGSITLVASDASDRAVAIWTERASSADVLLSATYTPTGGWVTGGAVSLAQDTIEDPRLVMSDSGHAVAAWTEVVHAADIASNRYAIVATIYDGVSWGPPVEVTSRVGGFFAWVRPGIDDAGHVLLVWRASEGGVPGPAPVTASYFDGAAWGPTETVSAADASTGGLDVALGGNGHGVVIWPAKGLFARAFDPAAGFGVEQSLDDVHATDFARIALNANGDGVAVWSRDGALRAGRYTQSGGWEPPVDVDGPGTTSVQILGWPALVVDSAGDAATTWARYTSGAGISVRAARQLSGEGWSSAATLDASAGPSFNDFTYPDLVLGADGMVTVAWAHTYVDGTRAIRATHSLP